MILVCDIGNTNITVALAKGNRSVIILKKKIKTEEYKRFGEFLKNILSLKSISHNKITAAVICNVASGSTALSIKNILLKMTDAPVYIIGENLKVPIKNLYSKPKQLGCDRLVCSYAAMKIYGAPVIVIDFGTAITVDLVSENKEYLGGIIFCGINLSLLALHSNTALLPKLKLAHPKQLIGENTKGSMLSGVTFGLGSLVDGLIVKLRNKLKDNSIKVVATGGGSLFIKPYCKEINYFEPDLILKGMLMLENNRK